MFSEEIPKWDELRETNHYIFLKKNVLILHFYNSKIHLFIFYPPNNKKSTFYLVAVYKTY
jgi:hypothetical protein